MNDLTLARLDAAILKSLDIKIGPLTPDELGATTIRCQFSDIRAIALAVMKAAERIAKEYRVGTPDLAIGYYRRKIEKEIRDAT